MDKTGTENNGGTNNKENNKTEKNKDAKIEQFIRYLQAERNYSVHTARAYAADMRGFAVFLTNKHNSVSFENCTKQTVRDYLAFLYNNNLKKSSIGRKLAVLKSFYKFLAINSRITTNPVSAMATPKKEKKIPVFLTEQEILDLFDIPQLPLRDKAMLELLYSSGIRIEEMINLNLKDLDIISETVKVFGKGAKERTVPVGVKCLNAIKEYLDFRRGAGQSCKTDSPMFLNKYGGRISSRGARKALHGWFIKAGYLKKVSPHTIRHSFATHMLDRGCGIRTVQQILGHKNLATTQIYTHVTLESLRKIYNQAHPRK
ncbi:MAG: tyrosine recombinase XerC [Endomicrobiaceae bacterium]|nr:tyrosine recombinase XerC [Endomicrobiaceae bacterium]MDD3729600.1 tyrosine recombinase XerC [Endomicrobiaceae bacterium]MDD4165693.1 tyrosine recombinase XerC [Endomicrobiaceae bacterium]